MGYLLQDTQRTYKGTTQAPPNKSESDQTQLIPEALEFKLK